MNRLLCLYLCIYSLGCLEAFILAQKWKKTSLRQIRVKFGGVNAPRVEVDSKSEIDVHHACDEATTEGKKSLLDTMHDFLHPADIINYPTSRRPLADMSHDEVYVLDANMVICYKNKHILEWNKFADEHVALGKKFYMVSFNFDEVNSKGGCPDWCEALITDQPVTIAGMEPFYQQVLEEFEVKGKMGRELKADIMSIGVAGFAVASALESQISINDIKADKVIYLTHNLKVLKRLLGDEDKTQMFENLVDENGLEHLIALRGVFNDGTFRNYW